jgi:predicted nucleic acid-binding protein
MTRLLLDTSGYSAFMHGHRQVGGKIREADGIVMTPVVIGELRDGFRRGTWRSENERGLDDFLGSPRVRVEVIDEETADRYAEIASFLRRAGTPIPTNDVWIAASAMQHGLPILTTDSHFERVPHVLIELHP